MFYKHYKGDIYEFVGKAEHTETGEELVIYKGKDGRVWARPKKMFYENILIDGEKQRRFQPIRLSVNS